MAEELKDSARADSNMGDLVQREHSKVRVEYRWGQDLQYL